MLEEIEDRTFLWQKKLLLVLDLIKTNPDSIIDDTSVEKLLSWLAETATDELQRNHLLHPDTNILVFLSNAPDTLLSSASCASFSLRLAGILAGCDEAVCKMLIECGSLQNLFAKFQSYDRIYFRNAVVKCAFFEGFSAIVSTCTGLLWSTSLPGLIEYAIDAFNDASFYVVKSAISFIKSIFLATESHGANQKALKIRTELLSIIAKEYFHCEASKRISYLNLLHEMFDFNPALAWQILIKFGGVTAFMNSIQSKAGRLLQTISEVCYQLIQKGRTTVDVSPESSKYSIDICLEVLKVTVEIGKADIQHLYRHLSYIIYSNETSTLMNVPEYWNKAIITIALWSLIRKQCEDSGGSIFFDKTLIPNIDCNTMPEEFALSFHNLESLIDDTFNDTKMWKKCLTIAMDTCKPYFSKTHVEALDGQGTYLVQCWSLFLCEILEVVSRDKEGKSSSNDLLFCLIGQRHLTNKCITVIKEILKNGWFNDFSTYAKMKIISSLIQVLDDQSSDTKTLSSAIHLFGPLIDVLSNDLKQVIFADAVCSQPLKPIDTFMQFQSSCRKLPELFEKLLHDSRWEIKDSVLELVSFMVVNSKGSGVMEEFLNRERFWLKSWSFLDADESYVRSTCVRLIGLVHESRKLRDTLSSSLSLEEVLSKLFNVFEEDDEAFPKRSIIDAIYRWLDLKELTYFLLQSDTFEKDDKIMPYEIKVWDFIFKVLNKASANLDWEVKMKGILCWSKILKIGKAENETLERDQEISKKRKRCLEMVCKRQGSSILISSLNDCDKLVCESAFDTLQWIRNNYDSKYNKETETDITSAQDMANISDFDISSLDKFLNFIYRIDFEQLEDSIRLADDEVINNPVSLLNDIIAASKANDDNLLDCY